MRVIDYKVVGHDGNHDDCIIDTRIKVVLLEDETDNTMNNLFIQGGADNSSAIGKAWNAYLGDLTGLVDEDVFYFMQAGEEQDKWELDGIKMERID